MASKFSRPALAAVAAAGVSGLVVSSASAAAITSSQIPNYLVNQPGVSAAINVGPESATLTGTVDTGGAPATNFSVAPGQTLTWDGSFNITNTGKSDITEWVDGLPDNKTSHWFPVNGGGWLNNNGADNNSAVTFEYDPYSDFVANGNAPGPDTEFAPEVDVPTNANTASVTKTNIGGWPAANAEDNGMDPLKPNTKYVYWVVQQAGETTSAETINTAAQSSLGNATATAVNPTWSCQLDSVIAQDPLYSQYTSTGTISGGLVAAGGAAQTTPQPMIQGPCVVILGGTNNFYQSGYATFTTPKLGSVDFAKTGKVSGKSAFLTATDNSVEPAAGKIKLVYAGKTLGTGSFAAGAHATHGARVTLTAAGLKYLTSQKVTTVDKTTKQKTTKVTKPKPITVKIVYTGTTDQPASGTSVTL